MVEVGNLDMFAAEVAGQTASVTRPAGGEPARAPSRLVLVITLVMPIQAEFPERLRSLLVARRGTGAVWLWLQSSKWQCALRTSRQYSVAIEAKTLLALSNLLHDMALASQVRYAIYRRPADETFRSCWEQEALVVGGAEGYRHLRPHDIAETGLQLERWMRLEDPLGDAAALFSGSIVAGELRNRKAS